MRLTSSRPVAVWRRRGVRYVSRAAIISLCLPVLLAFACGPADSEEPFVIGSLDPLTGIGESYGVPLSQSKLLAVEEINAAGGINGRMVKLIVEDTKCTANDAITAYRRLTDVEGIKIILGATCSGATLGVAPLAEREGVIIFSPSSTSPT